MEELWSQPTTCDGFLEEVKNSRSFRRGVSPRSAREKTTPEKEGRSDRLEQMLEGLAALNYRKDIPEFSGDLDDNTTLQDWLMKANKVGTDAGWTDEQMLKFFQSKQRRAAASYNNSLGPNSKVDLTT